MIPAVASVILGTKNVKSDSPLSQECLNRIVASTKFTPLGFDLDNNTNYPEWNDLPSKTLGFQHRLSKSENIYKDPELKHHHHLIVKENIYASIKEKSSESFRSTGSGASATKKKEITVVKIPHDVNRGMSLKHLLVNLTLYLLGFFLFSLTLILCVFSILFRQLVAVLLLCVYGSKVRLMDVAADALWGYEDKNSSSNIVFIMKIQGEPDFDRIVEDFERKVLKFRMLERSCNSMDEIYEIHYPYDKLKWIVKQKLFFFCWEKDKTFNVRNHFFLERVMDIGNNVNDRIQAISEAYLEYKLDPLKPQWEFRIITPMGGLRDATSSDYGLIFCVHHSYGDGFSWLQMLRQCLADEPVQLTMDPLKTPRPSIAQTEQNEMEAPTLFHRLRCIFHLPHYFASLTIHTLKERNTFHTSVLKGTKICQWTEKNIAISGIKSVRHKSGKAVLFTSVIMSCVTKAFQRCFLSTDAKVPFDLLASVPYAHLPYKTMEPTNNYATAVLPLPTRFLRNRQRRLKINDQTARQAASKHYMEVRRVMVKIVGSLIVPLIRLHTTLVSRSTVALSNLPGPKDTIHVFGGQPVTDLILFSPTTGCTGISMGILSYCGRLNVTFTVDGTISERHPNISQIFLPFFEEEMQEFIRLNMEDASNNFGTPNKPLDPSNTADTIVEEAAEYAECDVNECQVNSANISDNNDMT